jgi:hypothetical protein
MSETMTPNECPELDAALMDAGTTAAPLFRAHGWTWAWPQGVPGAEDLAEAFRERVAQLKKPGDVTRCGRLLAFWDGLEVIFAVEVGDVFCSNEATPPRSAPMADAREEAALRAEVARLEAENARLQRNFEAALNGEYVGRCEVCGDPVHSSIYRARDGKVWHRLCALAPPPAPADEVSDV